MVITIITAWGWMGYGIECMDTGILEYLFVKMKATERATEDMIPPSQSML